MTAICEVCGEPMPAGEEMFKFHGYSGPCPMRAEFVKQDYGAMVATIHDTPDGLLEVVDLGDGAFNLIVHSRRGETDNFDDLSIRLEPKHFTLLGSIALR